MSYEDLTIGPSEDTNSLSWFWILKIWEQNQPIFWMAFLDRMKALLPGLYGTSLFGR